MRTWIIGGCAAGIAVVAAIVFVPPKSNPSISPAPVAQESNPAPATQSSAKPAVLAEVIDVTDIDPLLDPPVIPQADPGPSVPMLTAVGYEVPTPRPTEPAAPVVPIPPAAEDEPVEGQ